MELHVTLQEGTIPLCGAEIVLEARFVDKTQYIVKNNLYYQMMLDEHDMQFADKHHYNIPACDLAQVVKRIFRRLDRPCYEMH